MKARRGDIDEHEHEVDCFPERQTLGGNAILLLGMIRILPRGECDRNEGDLGAIDFNLCGSHRTPSIRFFFRFRFRFLSLSPLPGDSDSLLLAEVVTPDWPAYAMSRCPAPPYDFPPAKQGWNGIDGRASAITSRA